MIDFRLMFTDLVHYTPLYVLLMMSILDWMVGIISSIILRTTSSKIGMNGILRKVMMYLSLIAVATVSFAFTDYSYVLDIFVMFYIFNEIISILENLVESGVSFPNFILEMFKEERGKYEEYKQK